MSIENEYIQNGSKFENFGNLDNDKKSNPEFEKYANNISEILCDQLKKLSKLEKIILATNLHQENENKSKNEKSINRAMMIYVYLVLNTFESYKKNSKEVLEIKNKLKVIRLINRLKEELIKIGDDDLLVNSNWLPYITIISNF